MTTNLDITTIRDFLARVKQGKIPCICDFERRREEFDSVLRVYTKYRIEQFKIRRNVKNTPFYQEWTRKSVSRHNELNEHIIFYANRLRQLSPCRECSMIENPTKNTKGEWTIDKPFKTYVLSVNEYGNVEVQKYKNE